MDTSDIQVLCVGDTTPDRSVRRGSGRVPPRAPVPIPRLRGTREALAAADNVAAHGSLGQATGTEVMRAPGWRMLAPLLAPGLSTAGTARVRQPAVPA